MSAAGQGPDAQWYRHVLYGLAGETFEAQQALDAWESAHAHELAEQQRQEMKAPGQSYDASRWNRCVGMTADLIDPEKP